MLDLIMDINLLWVQLGVARNQNNLQQIKKHKSTYTQALVDQIIQILNYLLKVTQHRPKLN